MWFFHLKSCHSLGIFQHSTSFSFQNDFFLGGDKSETFIDLSDQFTKHVSNGIP